MGLTPSTGQTGSVTDLPVLRRDRTDAKLAGVCAAVARSWNVDPLLVRVGFVVLMIVTNGFAIAAYLAIWALVPERGAATDAAPIRDLVPQTRTWSTHKLVGWVVGGAVVLGLLTTGSGPGALVVVALAVAILRWGMPGPAATPTVAPTAEPRTDFERLALAWQQRLDNVELGLPADWTPVTDTSAPSDAAQSAPLASGQRRASVQRRGTLRTWSGVAIGLGVAWSTLAALQAGGETIVPLAWASATLAVLAMALVVVARPARASRGRPRGLLPLAVATGMATVGLMVPAPWSNAPAVAPRGGPATTYSTTILPADEDVSVGSRTVDLSDVVVTADHTVRFHADMGALRVRLPAQGNVVVTCTADLGSISVDGSVSMGPDLEKRWERIGDPVGPTLTIDLSVDVGSIEVVS